MRRELGDADGPRAERGRLASGAAQNWIGNGVIYPRRSLVQFLAAQLAMRTALMCGVRVGPAVPAQDAERRRFRGPDRSCRGQC
eukprot:5524503-Alexandrium_andersonii.AAC.1